jgi:hypothetical protein
MAIKEKQKVAAGRQTLEQWWAEDAARVNSAAKLLGDSLIKTPEREDRDFSEWESLVDKEYRAFCKGITPPDNSCPPANKGGGGKKSGANKKGGKSVLNKGRKVKFGTVAKAALDNLRKTGGFSVHPVTSGSPTTGYMVSVKPEAEVVYDSVSQVNEAAFRDFYRANAAAFAENPNLHFGGWVDTNTGKVYFDLSARYDNVREAVDAAKATNQLAIWHLDEGREIRKEDYDARRKQGRAKATRAVRFPRRTARRRGAGLQGDGGGVSGVRAPGNGRQAWQPTPGQRGQVVFLPGRGQRAFCPGVSPPDNSCSPANKGTGKEPAPEPPEPAYDDTVITGRDDPRGALTGHNESQRKKYAEDTTKWLADRGINLTIEDDGKGSPSVDTMLAVMRGIEAAERMGVEPPEQIAVKTNLRNAAASYNYVTGEIFVAPDLSVDRLRESIEGGFTSGDPSNPAAAPLFHELTHRDHSESVRERYANPAEKLYDWIGRPERTPDGIVRTTVEPWAEGRAARPTGITKEEAKQIAASVSSYAATNPVEFVAEVRTAMSGGRRFSRPVMKLYRDYLGPAVPSDESPVAEAA